MSMTVSVRVQHNNMSKAAGQRRHDLRSGVVVPAYVNQDRSHLNSAIIAPMMEAAARKECEERRGQNPHKREMKSTAAVLTNGIITFGAEAQPVIQSLPTEKQDQIYKDIAKRLADQLNTDLVGLTVHRDEASPHAHFSMLAVNRNGQPLSKAISKDVAKELQDLAGQVLADHGLGEITRGKPRAQRIDNGEDLSKIVHRNVRKLHEDLPREIAQIEQKRIEIVQSSEAMTEKLDYYKKLLEKAENELKTKQENAEKLQKRIDAYSTRIQKLDALIIKKESVVKGIKTAMPELKTQKQLLSKNLSVAPENVAKFITETSEFLATAIARNTRKKQTELDDFAKSLDARETILTKKEADFNKKMRGAVDLEERNQDLVADNQHLRQRINSVGLHLAHIVGIENPGMNAGKVLKAVEKTMNIDDFRRELEKQTLNRGSEHKPRGPE